LVVPGGSVVYRRVRHSGYRWLGGVWWHRRAFSYEVLVILANPHFLHALLAGVMLVILTRLP
jgi:hypothetical protein